jgi:hypothetical protein
MIFALSLVSRTSVNICGIRPRRPKGSPAPRSLHGPIQPQPVDFLGTFAPFLRASAKPIAIACFLLLTTPPLPPFPDRKVPCFLRRIALLTVLLAARPYLAIGPSNLTEIVLRRTIAVGNFSRDQLLSVKPRTQSLYMQPRRAVR